LASVAVVEHMCTHTRTHTSNSNCNSCYCLLQWYTSRCGICIARSSALSTLSSRTFSALLAAENHASVDAKSTFQVWLHKVCFTNAQIF